MMPHGRSHAYHSSEKHKPWSPSDDRHTDSPLDDIKEMDVEMLLQPETRPISHEALVIEVRGICAGLVMVEAKCVDIDERQAELSRSTSQDPTKLTAPSAIRVHRKAEQGDAGRTDDLKQRGPPPKVKLGESERLGINERQSVKSQEQEPPKKSHPTDYQYPTGIRKTKLGLAGFANGSKISAMADTGSQKNIISASFVAKLGLNIKTSPCSFTIGSSRQVHSVGTVSLSWSFAEKPKETIAVICHVLPRCIYDLILGNKFLTITETMSKYRNRLSKCVFSMINRFSSIAFLGETSQRLEGTLADTYNVFAVPDTGAERNVMTLQYAIANNLTIKSEPEYRNWLQFADESIAETVGQVRTYWTFANGERISLTFEILEDCCFDVIIGEDILTEHNVFQDHASSLVQIQLSEDSYELAPFDFISGWQQAFRRKFSRKSKTSHRHENNVRLEEQRRRDIWNFENNFGRDATHGE